MSNHQNSSTSSKAGILKRVFKAGIGFHLASDTNKSLKGIVGNFTSLFVLFNRKESQVTKIEQKPSAYEFWRRYKNVQYSAYTSFLIAGYCAYGAAMCQEHVSRFATFLLVGLLSLALYTSYTKLLYQVRIRLREKKQITVSWIDYLGVVLVAPMNLLPLSLPKNKKKWGAQ